MFFSFCIDSQSKRKDERVVLQRLFRYSLPDWKIITFGTILLLSAALCKYYSIFGNKIKKFCLFLAEVFVPLYTGRLLSSVAFKEAWLQFKYNLIMFVIVNFSGYEK
jgi:hypothetical protein